MSNQIKESHSKWICEYCTYENWPSSLKCTMCRGSKPLLGEDIYRLRDQNPQRSGSNDASGPVPLSSSTDLCNFSLQNIHSQNVPSGGNWSCELCTYLNYNNAIRCIQCNSKKPVNINQQVYSASNLHEHLAPLRLSDPPPPQPSPTPPPNSGQNISTLTNTNIDKWSCLVCTYENWPKAIKCVMCGFLKERDKKDKSCSNSCLILPSPEKDHNQRGLPSPPQPFIHQAQRDDNSAMAKRQV